MILEFVPIPQAAGSIRPDRRMDREPCQPKLNSGVRPVAPGKPGQRLAAAANAICACSSQPPGPTNGIGANASGISTPVSPKRPCTMRGDVMNSARMLNRGGSWLFAISLRVAGSMRSSCREESLNGNLAPHQNEPHARRQSSQSKPAFRRASCTQRDGLTHS